MNKLRLAFKSGSVIFLMLSLTQDAYLMSNGQWVSGLFALLTGWLGMTSSLAALAWIANPFLICSWFLPARRLALYCSLIAFFLAISFLWADTIIASEAGNTVHILERGLGYYWWLAAIAFSLSSNVIARSLHMTDNQK